MRAWGRLARTATRAWAATAAVAVLLGAGACSGGGRSSWTATAHAPGSATTNAGTPAPVTTGGTSGSAPGSGAGSAATSAGGGQPVAGPVGSRASTFTGATAPPRPAGPATPLPPGSYRYDTRGSSSVSGGATATTSYPPVTTLNADPPQGQRQHSTRDLRDTRGNGTVVDATYDFEASGVYLVDIKTTTSSVGISDEEEFRPSPPALVAPTGARPGAHLQFTMSNSTTTAQVTIDVLGSQTLTIGGAAVSTLEVRTVTRLSGEVSGQTTIDAWVSPDHNLNVKEHVVADGQVGLSSFHTDYTATLEHLGAA